MNRERPGAGVPRRYRTMQEALDAAQQMLAERFGQADQGAAVSLASCLYTMQDREAFETEPKEREEVPYRA